MALSPNFGWDEPDNSDFVKDGALAIRTVVNSIDAQVWAMNEIQIAQLMGAI
ncbi:MAG: hypothetical protein ACO3E4_05630 [Candidatus Nanopelagicaceae bacterium]